MRHGVGLLVAARAAAAEHSAAMTVAMATVAATTVAASTVAMRSTTGLLATSAAVEQARIAPARQQTGQGYGAQESGHKYKSLHGNPPQKLGYRAIPPSPSNERDSLSPLRDINLGKSNKI